MSVRRTVGDRPGFYGTSGTAWLAPTLDELPYPELWSARSTLGCVNIIQNSKPHVIEKKNRPRAAS